MRHNEEDACITAEQDAALAHLAQVRVVADAAGVRAAAALQVRELALEVVHRAGVHEAGLLPPARQVVRQHVRVVLQDLPVDQVPHLHHPSSMLTSSGHARLPAVMPLPVTVPGNLHPLCHIYISHITKMLITDPAGDLTWFTAEHWHRMQLKQGIV